MKYSDPSSYVRVTGQWLRRVGQDGNTEAYTHPPRCSKYIYFWTLNVHMQRMNE